MLTYCFLLWLITIPRVRGSYSFRLKPCYNVDLLVVILEVDRFGMLFCMFLSLYRPPLYGGGRGFCQGCFWVLFLITDSSESFHMHGYFICIGEE